METPVLLVVDDESVVTFMLSKKLGDLGIRVISASHGEEALRLAKQSIPFAILTDYDMPRMTGAELATHLHAEAATRDIPIIMLTGRRHRINPSEFAHTNIQQVLSKPFSAREIVSHVQELLAEHLGRANRTPPGDRQDAA